MYGKLFVQMFDGTLGSRGPWEAMVAFQNLIILANRHGEVDMTIEAISKRTTIPMEIFVTGIEALERPDPESRTPDCEGRRIVRLDDARAWGWRIVNYERYRKIGSDEDRREYQRKLMQTRRAGEKNGVSRSCPRKWCRKSVSLSSVLPLGLLPYITPAPVLLAA